MMQRAESFIVLRRKPVKVRLFCPPIIGHQSTGIMHAGLRHLLPDHQLPHRDDAQAQDRGLYHPIHGGRRQGDIGDEALAQRARARRRRVVLDRRALPFTLDSLTSDVC